MKRVFLFSALFLLLGTAFVNAQDVNRPQTSANVGVTPIQRGNWIVGGSIGGIGYSFESEIFSINVNPRAGYFISDGVAIGIGLTGSLDAVSGADNVWGYGLAPFVRYYFPEGSSASGRFFAQGDLGIGGSSVGSDVALNVGANVGYAHFITQSVALEATLGYNYSKANISSSSGFSGLGVGVGFQIYLPGQR